MQSIAEQLRKLASRQRQIAESLPPSLLKRRFEQSAERSEASARDYDQQGPD